MTPDVEIERLRTALRKLRAAFSNENGLNAMSIVDTVWVSEIETALDCIDAALKGPDQTTAAKEATRALFGVPRCAKGHGDCDHSCEYGLAGPCVKEAGWDQKS